jgi:hypothetical protein
MWKRYFRIRAYASLALIIASLLSSGPVLAAYTCTGPVVGLTLVPDGTVFAEQIAGINRVYLCKLNGTTTLNTSTDTCKSIYAMLLSAQTTGKSVMLWFEDSLSCSTHPTWTALTGWYFGPQLQN